MNHHDRCYYDNPVLGLFENMSSLDEQAIWDLLEMLYALIDAYEGYYAEPLQRLRAQRQQELNGPDTQLSLHTRSKRM